MKGRKEEKMQRVPQCHPPLPSMTVAFDSDLLVETDEGIEV